MGRELTSRERVLAAVAHREPETKGGFIIGPGHTYIQPDAPLENILAMYETAYRECLYR